MPESIRSSTPRHPDAPFSNPGWQLWPGLLLASLLLILAGGGLGALFWQAELPRVAVLWENRYLRNVLSFTLWQATLSVALSLLLALPVARALARQPCFPGRSLLLRLMELSLVVPTIVAVSGVVGVYGRQGWLTTLVNDWAPALSWNLYGINGIVLTHVFFNAPLAARILLQTLENVPQPQWRIASQLGLSSGWVWRALEWPALRPVLPGIAALIFTLCFTSFAIIMTLGGGPAATTLEVAIYQSLRFDFDFGRAALLATVQLLICGSVWWLASRRDMTHALVPGRQVAEQVPRKDGSGLRGLWDRLLLLTFTLFLIAPLAAVALRGLPGLVSTLTQSGSGGRLWDATLLSLAIAIPAGASSVLAALLVLASNGSTQKGIPGQISATAAYLPLMVPPLVLGTGLFLLLRPQLGVTSEGLILVGLINSIMALPFVLQMLRGPLRGLDIASIHQADQLGILGWYRWRWLHWPRMRRPFALAMAYATGLSLGDFGVIALFGSPEEPTIPVLLYQQLGSYQMAAAAGTGLWLITVLLAVFALFNLLGRPPATAHLREPEHA